MNNLLVNKNILAIGLPSAATLNFGRLTLLRALRAALVPHHSHEQVEKV